MALYEYKCNKCQTVFEAEQRMTDDPFKIHDNIADPNSNNCGGELSKVFSSVGIVWKGSGFYKTDSRSGTSSKAKTSKDSDGAGASSALRDRSDATAPSESSTTSKEKENKTNDVKTGKSERKASKSPGGDSK